MDAQLFMVILAGVLGSMLGSFLNVCILRLPRGASIVFPSSHCPSCSTPIRWFDNIPILSYLYLRGKCRQCLSAISIQYPLVEGTGAVLMVALYLRTGISYALLCNALLLFILLGIAVTDAREYIIPDGFSLGGLLLGLASSFLPGGITPLWSVTGALIGGGSLFLVALVGEWIYKKEAMGGGDIKMIAMIGAFLGWQGVLFTILVGSFVGSLIFGWINYIMRKKKLVPFGVFLTLGASVYVFAGEELISWYILTFIY